jgi:hypothetical protein
MMSLRFFVVRSRERRGRLGYLRAGGSPGESQDDPTGWHSHLVGPWRTPWRIGAGRRADAGLRRSVEDDNTGKKTTTHARQQGEGTSKSTCRAGGSLRPSEEVEALGNLRKSIGHLSRVENLLMTGSLNDLSEEDSAKLAHNMRTASKIAAASDTLAHRIRQAEPLTDSDDINVRDGYGNTPFGVSRPRRRPVVA